MRPLRVVVQPRAVRGGAYVPVGYAYSSFGSYGLPSRVRGVGTFSGSVQAVSDYGNGIYFGFDGPFSADAPVVRTHPTAKIIVVKPDLKNGGCSMESGVCVIRP